MRPAQLKAFHAVATWGGFSRAAKKLGLSQPAVSDHVRKLEETYGVQLFIRAQKSVSLTALGRQLFVLSEKIAGAEAEARDLLSRARGLKEGQLTIGADAAVHVLPLLSRFQDKYPGMNLKVVSGNSDTLLSRLEAFDIDFAVIGRKVSSAIFETRLLSSSGLAAFVSEGHPLSGKARVTFSQLVATPLVLREKGSATRQLFEDALAARNLAPVRAVEVEGREAAREAVVQGLGAGIVSRSEFQADERLTMIEIDGWQAEMSEWLVCLKSRAGLHMTAALLELVDES
ncbi:MAG TPA: LysR family transcriptional regulator, partial [Rhizobiales bacterium]|nr:LysR family transcriptional regulator [Hyphomicrobiales bacterium]